MKRKIVLIMCVLIAKTAFGQWETYEMLTSRTADEMYSNETSVFVFSEEASSLFRSNDNGFTWQEILNIPRSNPDNRPNILNHFINEDTLLLCNRNFIYKSFDNGNSWSYSTIVDANSYFFIGNIFYCQTIDQTGLERKIFASTDFGENWELNTTSDLNNKSISSSVEFQDTTYVILVSYPYQLCKLTDIDNFIVLNEFDFHYYPIRLISNNVKMYFQYLRDDFVYLLECDGNGVHDTTQIVIPENTLSANLVNDTIFITMNGQFYYTNDEGQSWNVLEFPEKRNSVNRYYRLNNVNYALCSNYILRENSVNQWDVIMDIFFPAQYITDLFKINNVFLYNNCGSLIRKTVGINNSIPFFMEYNDSIIPLTIFPLKNIIMGFNENLGFFRSDDYGINWDSIDNGIPFSFQGSAVHFFSNIIEQNDTLYMGLNNDYNAFYLLSSVDFGLTWNTLYAQLDSIMFP
ncbi:MAG: hypothetical protein PHP52_13780, partial [Bacteroidales bacterium]|nr:hypothetical protein [Bacteroidales bacterium]